MIMDHFIVCSVSSLCQNICHANFPPKYVYHSVQHAQWKKLSWKILRGKSPHWSDVVPVELIVYCIVQIVRTSHSEKEIPLWRLDGLKMLYLHNGPSSVSYWISPPGVISSNTGEAIWRVWVWFIGNRLWRIYVQLPAIDPQQAQKWKPCV